MSRYMKEATRALIAGDEGSGECASNLLPLVYDELRRLAATKLSHEKPGQTLQATALVHEAYLRMVRSSKDQAWDSPGHFFAAAAESMRRILVENARRKMRIKHGGSYRRVDVELSGQMCVEQFTEEEAKRLCDLDRALRKLAAEDSIKARVVELRYFAGLTIAETASALGISHATVERYWTYARAWLMQAIADDDGWDDG